MHPALCYTAMTQALHEGELPQARALALQLRICLDEGDAQLIDLPISEIRQTTDWVLRRLTHLP